MMDSRIGDQESTLGLMRGRMFGEQLASGPSRSDQPAYVPAFSGQMLRLGLGFNGLMSYGGPVSYSWETGRFSLLSSG